MTFLDKTVCYIKYGDDMKNSFYVPLVLSIVIGFISAQIVYNSYQKNILENEYNAYLIKVDGQNNNDSYYVFDESDYTSIVGITTNILNANKLKKIFEKEGMSIYIKPVIIDNEEFINSLKQYDILVNEVDDEKNLISINDVILSSYKELVFDAEM